MGDDASATYRGYRKQALYALGRIWSDGEGRYVYRPEGSEDLAVFDHAQQLVEVVQVKDFVNPLSLSDFKPQSPIGYFSRMLQRRQEYPRCKHTIASYGPLGPELLGAINGAAPQRLAVVQKLNAANPTIDVKDASTLLDALQGNIERPVESVLKSTILQGLAGTIAAGHTEAALDLLLYWMFDAAEHRRDITRHLLLTQVECIGEFLAAVRDSSSEWMKSIIPIRSEDLTEEDRDGLRAEFRRGVHASWRHILASADCARPNRLAQIHAAIQRHSIVIVRGASGQGKSSLGWRYLHEYGADGLRFHVRLVDGRLHALQVAHALQSHTKSLQLSPLVFLDVSPADAGWVELLGPLAESGLKVIVAVREEDFRRAGVPKAELDIGEVVLDQLTRDEAQEIYSRLSTHAEPSVTLDFEDAWTRYSAPGGGPLLEFTHIILAGERLTARIEKQIHRIQSEVGTGQTATTPAHLRLLALCALAHAADCRVDATRLYNAVKLEPLTRPLALFQNEYLLRLDDAEGQSCVAPLHPVRSQAMLRVMLEDCPEAWSGLAIETLSLVVDADIDTFLMTALSDHPEGTEALQDALSYLPLRTWTHAAGVARALLWAGVDRFERENRVAFAETIQRHRGAWWMLCDLNLGTSVDISSFRDLFTKGRNITLPMVPHTSKYRVFDPFQTWASRTSPPLAMPTHPADWSGSGDVAFWVGVTSCDGPLRHALIDLLPHELSEGLGTNELGAFISGQHAIGDSTFLTWHNKHRLEIVRRFLADSQSVYVEDDGENVKVYFSITTGKDGTAESEQSPHEQSVLRVNLLRQLFPHRSNFGAQGFGLEAFADIVHHDPTTKQIRAENLPDRRAVDLNAQIQSLVEYRHRRADSWNDYVEVVRSYRRKACAFLCGLRDVWQMLLAETPVKRETVNQFPHRELQELEEMGELPMLPRVAVDEWGHVSEGMSERSDSRASKSKQWTGLRRLRPWNTAIRNYESAIGELIRRAPATTVHHINVKLDEARPASANQDGHLLLTNLEKAWDNIEVMQAEFTALFGNLVASAQTDAICESESRVLQDLWYVAFAFVHEPRHRRRNAAQYLANAMAERRRDFLRRLVDSISEVLGTQGRVVVRSDNCYVSGNRCLLIACDHDSFLAVAPTKPIVVEAIWRAARSQAWTPNQAVPLLREWTRVCVVHQVRGRAVLPAGAQISTSVFFAGESEGFQAEPHHVFDLPIPESDLVAAELRVWDTPLLRAVVTWQGALGAFVLGALRGNAIADFADEKQIPDSSLSGSNWSFEQELTTLLAFLRRSHEELRAVLLTVAMGCGSDAIRAKSWLATLGDWHQSRRNRRCSEEDTTACPDYVRSYMQNSAPLTALVSEVIDCAIAAASANGPEAAN